MKIIRLLNDELEFIDYDDNLVDLVRCHMGNDMALVVKELINDADDVKYRADKDFLSYELSLEESREGYIEIRDLLELMTKEIDKKKINKNHLMSLIDNIENIVNRNI